MAYYTPQKETVIAMEVSKKISEVAKEEAFHHRKYLSDGDIYTDIEELTERVRELCWDSMDSAEANKMYNEWYEIHDPRMGLAMWNGVRDYYCEVGGASIWEDDYQLTEQELAQAFSDALEATPYNLGTKE